MNKIKLLVVAAVALFSAVSASAQKTGYISLDQVVGLMPEVAKIDTALQRYQSDSLNPQYAYMISEYQRKDSLVNGKDSLKNYPASAVRAQIRQELEGMAYQIQNWQSIVQNAMQSKQGELLDPVYRKVMNALNAVAKENGYSFVISQENLLVAPPNDNLLPLVAKKLNIKLPAGAGAAPAGGIAPKK
ncbi:MAG: OmpH family outer membrane protein [Flaviaesturariibacter sp.]|nr:OmpH family outer membrane protein [Flaviaesturariibacter sp.]